MNAKLSEAGQTVVVISEKCQLYEHKSAETLQELEEQKQNIDRLEATVTTYKSNVEEVTKQKNEAEVMMTKLESEYEHNKTQLESMETNVKSMGEKLASMQEASKSAAEDMTAVTNRIEQLYNIVADKDSKIDQLTKCEDSLKLRCEELEASKEALVKDLEIAKKAIQEASEIKTKISDCEQKIVELTKEIETKDTLASDLRNSLDLMEQEKERHNVEKENLNQELAIKSNLVKNLEQEIEKVQTEKKHMNESLQEKDAKMLEQSKY